MTRFLHFIVNFRHSCNLLVFVHDQGKSELLFWRDNLKALNGVLFWPVPFVPSVVIFSDASANGCAAFIQGTDLVFQRNWSLDESEKSSTWRKLAAIKFSNEAFGSRLSKQRVRWHTDGQNAMRIIQVGSMVRELQDLALSVFLFTAQRQIQLDLVCLPRRQNAQADFFSKVIDFDDYSVHDDVF